MIKNKFVTVNVFYQRSSNIFFFPAEPLLNPHLMRIIDQIV